VTAKKKFYKTVTRAKAFCSFSLILLFQNFFKISIRKSFFSQNFCLFPPNNFRHSPPSKTDAIATENSSKTCNKIFISRKFYLFRLPSRRWIIVPTKIVTPSSEAGTALLASERPSRRQLLRPRRRGKKRSLSFSSRTGEKQNHKLSFASFSLSHLLLFDLRRLGRLTAASLPPFMNLRRKVTRYKTVQASGKFWEGLLKALDGLV
jgi:hypothetical protein